MTAVLAGWAVGYFMAIVSTVALVYLVMGIGKGGAFLNKWIDPEVSRGLLTVPIFLGATIAWTMMGLVFGAIYEAADFAGKPGALGSPSWPFTLIVVALAWLALGPLVILVRRRWRLWCGMSMVFVVAFGWLMPLLAAR